MADLTQCFICNERRGIKRYADSVCSNCSQEYEYLWDGVAIVLKKQQIQLLKKHLEEAS